MQETLLTYRLFLFYISFAGLYWNAIILLTEFNHLIAESIAIGNLILLQFLLV